MDERQLSGIAVQSSGSGAPLVVLHGGGPGCSSRIDFAAVLPALGAEHTVIALDLHQHGRSAAPPIHGDMLSHHAAAVLDVLDQLDVARADFVCQSLGGLVALLVAALRPERVRRLVVTGSQPVEDPETTDPEAGRRLRAALLADGEPSSAGVRRLMADGEWFDGAGIPDALVAARHASVLREQTMLSELGPGERGTPRFLADELVGVTAPVLLLWGAHDVFASPTYAERLAGRLPRGEVAVIPDAAHHAQSERPGAYLSMTVEFLADGRRGGGVSS